MNEENYGDYLHSKYLSLECSIKEAIEQLTEVAKNEGKYYKQIWINDKDAKKCIFYRANFQWRY